MNLRQQVVIGAGLAVQAACGGHQPATIGHAGPNTATSPTGPATSPAGAETVPSVSPSSTAPAGPTTSTTFDLPTVPPTSTTILRPLPTTTLPERAGEDMGDVEWLVRQAFPETPDKAVRVARCESDLDPLARNGEHVGVMQIATKVHAKRIAAMGYSVADLFHVMPNLAVARALYDESGWAPWTCAA